MRLAVDSAHCATGHLGHTVSSVLAAPEGQSAC
jgi:hypothetical protein